MFRGQSKQIYVLRTATAYLAYLQGGADLPGAGHVPASDIAIIIGTNLRHEEYHRDVGPSERLAYQVAVGGAQQVRARSIYEQTGIRGDSQILRPKSGD